MNNKKSGATSGMDVGQEIENDRRSIFWESSGRASWRRWHVSRDLMKWGRQPCAHLRGKPSRWREEKMQRWCNDNLFNDQQCGHYEKNGVRKAVTDRKKGRMGASAKSLRPSKPRLWIFILSVAKMIAAFWAPKKCDSHLKKILLVTV